MGLVAFKFIGPFALRLCSKPWARLRGVSLTMVINLLGLATNVSCIIAFLWLLPNRSITMAWIGCDDAFACDCRWKCFVGRIVIFCMGVSSNWIGWPRPSASSEENEIMKMQVEMTWKKQTKNRKWYEKLQRKKWKIIKSESIKLTHFVHFANRYAFL